MVSMRPSHLLIGDYAAVLLNSNLGRAQAASAAIGGAHPHVNLKDIRTFRFPIPPVDVQRALLEARRHLMKLCDDLEAKLRRAEDRASKLVEAVVQEMGA
jgi:type I restriction enzyme S subunit